MKIGKKLIYFNFIITIILSCELVFANLICNEFESKTPELPNEMWDQILEFTTKLDFKNEKELITTLNSFRTLNKTFLELVDNYIKIRSKKNKSVNKSNYNYQSFVLDIIEENLKRIASNYQETDIQDSFKDYFDTNYIKGSENIKKLKLLKAAIEFKAANWLMLKNFEIFFSSNAKLIKKLLIELKINPNNIRSNLGLAPLHKSAESGDEKITELLLKAGADPNATIELQTKSISVSNKSTPLHLLLRTLKSNIENSSDDMITHYVETIKILLNYGANPNLKDPVDKTSINIADDILYKLKGPVGYYTGFNTSISPENKQIKKNKNLNRFIETVFKKILSFFY